MTHFEESYFRDEAERARESRIEDERFRADNLVEETLQRGGGHQPKEVRVEHRSAWPKARMTQKPGSKKLKCNLPFHFTTR